MNADLLSSWRDGPTKQAIVTFVEHICGEDGSAAVPAEQRLAVFDNDGIAILELHRLGRRPGLHAAHQPRHVRHPA
jgi:hypothetical protein